jgi:hypothetical protein
VARARLVAARVAQVCFSSRPPSGHLVEPYDWRVTGGGAATNAGIDFQARVAALSFVTMLADVADLGVLGFSPSGTLNEVRFETADSVDDLVLVLGQGRVLVQAKNSVTLSAEPKSELARVMGQVVGAHLTPRAGDHYLLAVSPTTSARIRRELKKLCIARRLNKSGASSAPYNEAENYTLSVARDHIFREFEAATGRACTEDFADSVLGALHVETFDVSEGGTSERLAVLALSTVSAGDPMALWRSLVATSVVLARDRMSIDRAGLMARFETLLKSTTGPMSTIGTAPADLKVSLEGSTSMGREVVLAQTPSGQAILAEFRRFDDDGSRRVHFAGGKAVLNESSIWQVLRRTATYAGMTRELEDGLREEVDGPVVIIPANFGDLEQEHVVQAHASAYRAAIESCAEILTCLVCGRQVSEDRSYSVEIDDDDHPYAPGIVHRGCLRPMHRVLGLVRGFDGLTSLVDFDVARWLRALSTGQGLWNSIRNQRLSGLVTVGWEPENAEPLFGGWAIALELEDRTTRYMHTRGKVHRANHLEAVRIADEMEVKLARAREAGDPFVYGSDSFGLRSRTLSAAEPDPLPVVSAHAVEVTAATVAAYSNVENYYAPLFSLKEFESGDPVRVAGADVLLDDPLGVEDLVANWRRAGVEIPTRFASSILQSDRDFDFHVSRAHAQGRNVIVNPVLGTDGGLVSAFLIEDLHRLSS